jgi:16S rRNA (adenine1518-N6/adenine1519-N6)-dimethyltransferase
MARSHGIAIKKQYGQHFLRDVHVVGSMLNAVTLDTNTSVFEVGPGDGFLTNTILQTRIARLWSFEIDKEWVDYLASTITNEKFRIIHQDFLDVDLRSLLDEHKPWTVLANLPYVITFPILYKFQRNADLIKEGVIMVQEEVAQKIVKKSGRGFGYVSLFLQHYFEWKMLDKIPPEAFLPPPKVYSRLLYFKPRHDMPEIPNEKDFWEFIKVCFSQPRRTLKNNLAGTTIDMKKIPESQLKLRAQQMNIKDFLEIWNNFI